MNLLKNVSRSHIVQRHGLAYLSSTAANLSIGDLTKNISGQDSLKASSTDANSKQMTKVNQIASQRTLKTGPAKMISPNEGSTSCNDSVMDLVNTAALDVCGDESGSKGNGDDGRGPCGGSTVLPSEDMLLDVPVEINLKLNVRLEEYEISAGKTEC